MIKYQLVYNGNESYTFCNTLEEAEKYKKNAAEQWPNITVEIRQIVEEEA
jgi:hypothetical protein